tara:strand:- start:109 stop:2451 length:2343 start_codon:yes stop_codon:yes gene_type:complete
MNATLRPFGFTTSGDNPFQGVDPFTGAAVDTFLQKQADVRRAVGEAKVFWARVFAKTSDALSYVSTQPLAWDAAEVAKSLMTKGMFLDTDYKSLGSPGMKRVYFLNAKAEEIALRLLTHYQGRADPTAEGASKFNPLTREELDSLLPAVLMKNQRQTMEDTPTERYGLADVQILMSERDGSRFPRWSKTRKAFIGADAQDPFRGYSIFPQTYRDYTDTNDFFLSMVRKEKEDMNWHTPPQLCSYHSYYFNGYGKVVNVVNHAYNLTTTPRLARGAIEKAAYYCNQEIDYFTIEEWKSILTQMAREQSPKPQAAFDVREEDKEDLYTKDVPFLAPGCMYMNEVPPAELTDQIFYHMQIRITWLHKQSPPVNVRAHVDVLPKPGAAEHWAMKLSKMAEWDKGEPKWAFYPNDLRDGKLYTFEFRLYKSENVVTMSVVGDKDAFGFPRDCIRIVKFHDHFYLDLIFWSTGKKSVCNLNWADDLESGFAKSVLRIVYDGAMYMNVPVKLLDGSHTPESTVVEAERPAGKRFFFANKDADEDLPGYLTATLVVLRGYGYYESMGFFPEHSSCPEDMDKEYRYLQERLDYQHMVATTPINKLTDAIRTYQFSVDDDSYPGGAVKVDPDGGASVFGVDYTLSNARKLVEEFKISEGGLASLMSFSLREIAEKINDGTIPYSEDTAGYYFMTTIGQYVRTVLTRTARYVDSNGDVMEFSYPGGDLQVNFYSFYGTNEDKGHYAVLPNKVEYTRDGKTMTTMGRPQITTRRVERVKDYRFAQYGRNLFQ